MNEAAHHWVVIPAAGMGQRMQAECPKQYLSVQAKTLLEHTIELFLQHPLVSRIVVVLQGQDSYWAKLPYANHPKVMLSVGGERRVDSVLSGVMALRNFSQPQDWVIVHDAARPCLSLAALNRLIDAVKQDEVGGILGVPVVDTLKRVSDGSIDETVSREQLWAAQTPQMFRYQLLCDALCNAIDADVTVTDEASAVEYAGLQPKIVLGDVQNIKVTTQQDLILAEQYLSLGAACE